VARLAGFRVRLLLLTGGEAQVADRVIGEVAVLVINFQTLGYRAMTPQPR